VPSGLAGARVFMTVAHQVIIGTNGAIAMRKRKTLEVEFSKTGHDGQEIIL
jgi:hypothetical protein